MLSGGIVFHEQLDSSSWRAAAMDQLEDVNLSFGHRCVRYNIVYIGKQTL